MIFSLFLIKNGIAYDAIVASLNNDLRTYTTVDSIDAAYETLMTNQESILLASSIEASYLSANVSNLQSDKN